MSPYRPSTSAKMRIRIMPTKSLGCCAVPLTPASPTMPIAKPDARPLRPTLRPAPRCRKLLLGTERKQMLCCNISSLIYRCVSKNICRRRCDFCLKLSFGLIESVFVYILEPVVRSRTNDLQMLVTLPDSQNKCWDSCE